MPPKRIRKFQSRKRTATHELYDGEVTLFRTPVSGNVWQFQMWIREQQKYLRRSTRCKDLNQAIIVGRDLYLDTHSKLRSNKSVFPKTIGEVCDLFLLQKEKEIGVNKTHGRWVTLRSQTKHILKFIGENTRITEIPAYKWDDYFNFRRSEHPEVVNTTLANEKNTIRTLYRFAISRNFVPPNSLPELPIISKHSRRREAFSLEDWQKIYRFMRTNEWIKDENSKVEEQRKFITDFVIILINTGIRFGEARRMKWKNIKIEKYADDIQKSHKTVLISLDEFQTKNKKARDVVGRRGDVFERIRRYSNFREPNDYVFVDNDTGNQLSRDTYYRQWNWLVKKLNLKEHRQDNSFYCFRHTYATMRLLAHTDVFALAKNMGTSVKFIEDHYGQTTREQEVVNLTKSFDKDEHGRYEYEGIILD